MLSSFWGLFFLFVIMGLATRMVILAFDKLVHGLTIKGKVAIAAIFVAISTSLPELFVAIASILEKKQELALGTLLGSNVADLSIVIGGATLLAGSLSVIGDYWRFELAAAFMAGIAPILLMMDGKLSQIDGVILIVIYLIYLSDLLMDGKKKRLVKSGTHEGGLFLRLRNKTELKSGKYVWELIAGIVAMFFVGDWIVKLSSNLALGWGLPIGVVGLLTVSIGTSLPEIFLSTGAIWKKNMALVLGNILGSVVVNATLIVGLVALFAPFSIEKTESYALANVAFVIIFGLFWMFTSTKKKLEKWEGLILVGLFLVFIGLTLLFPA